MDGVMHTTSYGLSLPGGCLLAPPSSQQLLPNNLPLHCHHLLVPHLLSGQSTRAFLGLRWCSLPPNIFAKPRSPEQGMIIRVLKHCEPYHLFLAVWPQLLLCLLPACWFVLHAVVSLTLLYNSLSSMASCLLPESWQYHTVLFTKDKSTEISRLRLCWHISCEREVC